MERKRKREKFSGNYRRSKTNNSENERDKDRGRRKRVERSNHSSTVYSFSPNNLGLMNGWTRKTNSVPRARNLISRVNFSVGSMHVICID